MLKKMGQFVREEEGQGMAEYGLILAGVAVVAIVGIKALGVQIDSLVDSVTDSFKGE
ncbi:Flp family type IVb pilin [Guptibacillus hwajinpoensis]|uniref:Flp family type IVb pilin n=1 Tax=Guptibacillus hwajinpoensis TaxID=208199 RepID=UPI001CFEF4D8|nr:Flp family type IVb pilin [Pseudalkalibacillus hwajinpoensis]WLR59255.1 Flp family type IVb pilin [Pseudalkalibacillus hwajinpoensis]